MAKDPRSSLVPSSAPPTKPSGKPPEQAHDDREIDVRAILRIGSLVAAMTAFAMGLLWWTKNDLEEASQPPGEPLPIAQGRGDVPPDPKLQPHPREGLAALRDKERGNLESYGWVDRDKKLARVPIERAIAITAERAAKNDVPGLTWRRESPPEPTVSRPSDASRGRAGGKP